MIRANMKFCRTCQKDNSTLPLGIISTLIPATSASGHPGAVCFTIADYNNSLRRRIQNFLILFNFRFICFCRSLKMGFPLPKITGCIQRWYASTIPDRINAEARRALPKRIISFPSCSLSRLISSIGSPTTNTERSRWTSLEF